MSTPLCLSTVLAAAVFAAPFTVSLTAQQSWAERFIDQPVDANVRIHAVGRSRKDDARDRLILFGMRPTIVVLGVSRRWQPSDLKGAKAELKKLDKDARTWARKGLECVLLVPEARMWSGATSSTVPLPLLEKARLKNVVASYLRPDEAANPQQTTLSDTLVASGTDSAWLRWMLLDSPGHVLAAGEDVFDGTIDKVIRQLSIEKSARVETRVHRSVGQWQLGEAMMAIEALRTKEAIPDERAEQLVARVDGAIEFYQRQVIEPLRDAGRLPEAAEGLAWLAERLGPSTDRRDLVETRRAELLARPDYANVDKARQELAEVRKRLAEYEEAVGAEYARRAKRAGVGDGYDERIYNSVVLEILAPLEPFVTEFVKGASGTHYGQVGGYLLRTLREDLADARSLAGGGVR